MNLIFKTLTSIAAVALTSTAVVGCGDKQQTAATPSKDTAPYAGTGVATFTTPGWKAGDKTAWEQQLKTRMQNGQNEYNKVN
jgi:hypothetical protein